MQICVFSTWICIKNYTMQVFNKNTPIPRYFIVCENVYAIYKQLCDDLGLQSQLLS